MRIGMGGRGKAASNAGSSGRHEITDSTPRTPLIGPDIEARAGGHEAQIMNTKSAREEAFLDTLEVSTDMATKNTDVDNSADYIIREYIDFVNQQVGVYMDAIAGFAGHHARVERQVCRVMRKGKLKENDEQPMVWAS